MRAGKAKEENVVMRLEQAVEATAPTRIDLAGGTVDLWPLYLFHPGAVTINAAVDLRVKVRVVPAKGPGIRLADLNANRKVEWGRSGGRGSPGARYELFAQVLRTFSVDQGLRIEFRSQAPKGAGLAGSSALLVALCGALMKSAGQGIRRDRFLALVRDIETRLIKVPAGLQDYYPAIWGGVQALWWRPGEVFRESLPVLPRELEKRLLLVYTGTSRHSGTNNWEVYKRHLDGDRRVRALFAKIVEASQGMVAALKGGDFRGAGRAFAAEAAARTRLFPGIMTPEMHALDRTLRPRGAIGTKVCGAGGGGCVVVYVDPDERAGARARIREMGFQDLPFKIVRKGLSFHRVQVPPTQV
jgi:D-glycero-alpha-D-manno-heptose-7-phosphate kinase